MSNHININLNLHSSIQIDDLFFDPYGITNQEKKAKFIFLTHTHFDHLSVEDIDKVIKDDTTIIATKDAETKLAKYPNKKIFVKPNESFELEDMKIETFPAYNINKEFHKREFDWVGYKIIKDGISYVITGDSDVTPELENMKCDIFFVPVGGTYTMTATEAAKLTNKIKPQLVIPIHYGSVVGTSEDAKTFLNEIDDDIICKIFF